MDSAVIKKFGIATLLLALVMSFAWAGGPEPGRGGGPPGDFRNAGGFGGGRPGSSPDQDAAQRRGKMSPDERRELRRQIDEAGQDIYRSKR
ncbi:hypothetical protein FHW67_001176 [Herbaspirillum sp. Sphag1AN]|uniref:hypothetical protein n=1 Tax=unclassified Herbaspirillum TaxID=2624150 RepID=UPI0016169A77|nr:MULTISPECIES: hypothetical protein [unclassified Herbaspirillum]MBB3211908.1 hypothetical protein [Herbaspirillum sp. Sphag1AN]MBB3244258.1 hypothetical protein [Herbaspirillum sp. Sphag64]